MRLRWALPLLVVLGSSPSASAAVTLPAPGMLAVEGTVNSIVPAGPRVVVTGRFDAVGRYVGGGGAVDPATGSLDDTFPAVRGQVSDAVPDGSGGWYVSGRFAAVGNVKTNNVAHLLPSGEADPAFRAPNSVYFGSALLFQPGSLYVADYDNGTGGPLRLDINTGRRIPGFAAEPVNNPTELEAGIRRIYVGHREGVRAIDPFTGATDPEFDCIACRDPGRVTALLSDSNTLYVGTVNGGVFAVDGRTGARLSSFAPSPNTVSDQLPDAGPLDFEIAAGGLLVGGRGMNLGAPSSTLVLLDRKTGAADPNFATGFDAPLHDLDFAQNDRFLAGGPPAGGEPPVLYTLDQFTGKVLQQAQTGLDGAIDAVASVNGRPYIGGRFDLVDRREAYDVVVLDAPTGQPVRGFSMAHHPEEIAYGDPPVVLGDRIIYTLRAGTFGRGREGVRVRLVAYSLRTGRRVKGFAPDPIYFDPRTEGASFAPVVRGRGGRLYVGHVTGDPSTAWPGVRIHVLDAASGDETTRYDIPFPGYLDDMLVRGRRLFAAGSFRRFHPDGRPRHLATVAMNALTGKVEDDFDAHTNGPVNGLGAINDRLFLAGYFDRAWGQERRGLSSVLTTLHGYPVRDFRPAFSGGTPRPLSIRLLSLDWYDPAKRLLDPYSGRRVRLAAQTGGRVDLLTAVRGRLFVSVSTPAYYDPAFVGYLPTGKVAG